MADLNRALALLRRYEERHKGPYPESTCGCDTCKDARALLSRHEIGGGDGWNIDGPIPTLCPECGPQVGIDEDGCCEMCGSNAIGTWTRDNIGWLARDMDQTEETVNKLPNQIERIIRDDEVVGYGVFHIERMADDHIWLHLGGVSFDLHATGSGGISFTPQDAEWDDLTPEHGDPAGPNVAEMNPRQFMEYLFGPLVVERLRDLAWSYRKEEE